MHTIDLYISEQALREIYLRFVVKGVNVWAVIPTYYNLLNSV